MYRVVIIGGGWSGCAAAVAAKKEGADVILIEKTDLLLGLGNVGGIMRNNGRYTATEENIALGAKELFEITDKYSYHKNIDFPGHKHASLYDIIHVEPAVRRLLIEMGVELRLSTRVIDCTTISVDGRVEINSVTLANEEKVKGDVFIECTGSTGPMGNCLTYGNGCSMCILRCPAFGPRVSITKKAGLREMMGLRGNGEIGAFSGSGKLLKKSLSKEIVEELNENGVAVIPLEKHQIKKEKLDMKVCQQYALNEYAENIILLDTGDVKIMTPYFPVDELRKIKGFENARYADPYAGGKGNSVRYLSVAERDKDMKVCGAENLFCAGEKSGLFVGHTEAITTGNLAGYNAMKYALGQETLVLPNEISCGDIIEYANEALKSKEASKLRYTFAGSGYFERMKEKGLYTTKINEIEKRIKKAGLSKIFGKN